MYYMFERQLKALYYGSASVQILRPYTSSNLTQRSPSQPLKTYMFFLALKKNIVLTALIILIVALFVHTWRHRTADPSCHTPTRTFTGNSSRVVWRNTEHIENESHASSSMRTYLPAAYVSRITPRCENRNDGHRRSWLYWGNCNY